MCVREYPEAGCVMWIDYCWWAVHQCPFGKLHVRMQTYYLYTLTYSIDILFSSTSRMLSLIAVVISSRAVYGQQMLKILLQKPNSFVHFAWSLILVWCFTKTYFLLRLVRSTTLIANSATSLGRYFKLPQKCTPISYSSTSSLHLEKRYISLQCRSTDTLIDTYFSSQKLANASRNKSIR